MIPRRLRIPLTAVLLFAVAACSDNGAPSTSNLLVITLDTTRADVLSVYGFPLQTSPSLAALSAGGVVFDQAYCPIGQTMPSHATLLTGRVPREHGLLDNYSKLDPEVLTLADLLVTEGYETAAIIGAIVLDEKSGINQGFTHFDVPPDGLRDADEVTDAALAWADGRADDEAPFMLWAHYFDMHAPYQAERKTFAPGAVLAATAQIEVPLPAELDGQTRSMWNNYVNEMVTTDEQVGRLLVGLEQRGLLQDTVIVVVGDHGESLADHGVVGHGRRVSQAEMRVPLIMVAPDGSFAGDRYGRPVGMHDVMPTAMDIAGLDPSAYGLSGRSVVSELAGEGGLRDVPVVLEGPPSFPRETIQWRPDHPGQYRTYTGIVLGRDKLVREPDDTLALYDIVADPHERRNLRAEKPAVAAQLVRALDEWLDSRPIANIDARVEVGSQRERTLRELGY